MMKKPLRKRIFISILIFVSAFILLFTFRIIYGYRVKTTSETSRDYYFDNFSEKKNYASKKYEIKESQGNQGITTVDQKYEKIANVTTKSQQFEEDENDVRKTIEQYNALIQFEQKSGNKGSRNLHMMIGVPPEYFDSLYNVLIKVGSVESKQITKNDKTNEYRELNAKKASLEKSLQSLIDLKSKGGRIDEYIQLENSIQSLQEQLQDLGISLGDFDAQNEFCTINFSLNEGFTHKISKIHRIKVALEWTISIYLKLIAITFLILFVSYLCLLIIDKLKLIEKIIRK